VESSSNFCPHCGASLRKAEAPIVEKAATVTPAPPPSQAEASRRWGRDWKAFGTAVFSLITVVGIVFLLTRKHGQVENANAPAAMSTTMPADTSGGGSSAMMDQVFQQVQILKNRIEKDPRDKEALLTLASLYASVSKFQEAIDYYQRYLTVNPSDYQVRMILSETHFRNGQFDKAVDEIQKVLKDKPDYDYAMYNLGVLYAHMNRKDEARKWWQRIVDAHPEGELAAEAKRNLEQWK